MNKNRVVPLRLEYMPEKFPPGYMLVAYVGSDEFPAREDDIKAVKEKLSSVGCTLLIFPHNVLLYSARKFEKDDEDVLYVAFVGNEKWDASHFDDNVRELIKRGIKGATGVATEVLLSEELNEGEECAVPK